MVSGALFIWVSLTSSPLESFLESFFGVSSVLSAAVGRSAPVLQVEKMAFILAADTLGRGGRGLVVALIRGLGSIALLAFSGGTVVDS